MVHESSDPGARRDARGRAGESSQRVVHESSPRTDPQARGYAGERGQASIEVIGLLPLIVLLALVGFTVVASFTAHEQAGEAAGAGALALLQGGTDPRAAARDALPKSVRSRATITLSGRRVHVRVRPRTALPIPGLATRLTRTAHADAGPSTP
ncbi:hypothetical protein OJ998_37230 [Solirubrobacter taibaiensis]|nr:hypothetical protein [Solirubrobacter taibaiensis]